MFMEWKLTYTYEILVCYGKTQHQIALFLVCIGLHALALYMEHFGQDGGNMKVVSNLTQSESCHEFLGLDFNFKFI